MSHLIRLISLSSLVVITAAGCTVPPRPGTPASPAAQVVPPDARAEAYGSSIEKVVQNPMIGNKVRAMLALTGAEDSSLPWGHPHILPRETHPGWFAWAAWTTSP